MGAHRESELDTKSEHLSDITQYIDNCLTFPSALKLQLKHEILEHCSGVFLWVVLVIRLLKELSDKGATRLQLHEALTSLPSELHALFVKISESAETGFADAMRWMLFTKRLWSLEELY